MWFILFAVFAYCIGSVNFSIILLLLLGKQDPRKGFSGNPGATNVYRQAGLPAAGAILFLDTGRAAAVSAAALYLFSPPGVAWSALALLAGNRYPCFHGFRGGKGVANYLGFSAVTVPAAAVVSCVAWAAVFRLVRSPFAGSFAMVAVLAGASILKWRDFPLAVAGAAAAALFIFYNHSGNLAEFFSGNTSD
ncbi:MAG: glycerol-3-phosphate acyltransferase [Desulfosalsimonas sp.]